MADTGITVDQLKTQLAQVQTAITSILTTGQSYNRPGLGLSHASLSELQEREQYLIRAIQRASEGMISVVQVGSQYEGTAEDNFSNPDAQ